MAKRPVRYDANLPRNLTYRKRDRLYSWRNPVTGQEISLGRIDRKDAVAQAIEANNYIDQNYLPSSLLDRIKDVPTFTVAAWLERYGGDCGRTCRQEPGRTDANADTES